MKYAQEILEDVLSHNAEARALVFPPKNVTDDPLLERLERSIKLRLHYDSTTSEERNFLRSLLNEIQNEKD